jgi:hypothetical protein
MSLPLMSLVPTLAMGGRLKNVQALYGLKSSGAIGFDSPFLMLQFFGH